MFKSSEVFPFVSGYFRKNSGRLPSGAFSGVGLRMGEEGLNFNESKKKNQ